MISTHEAAIRESWQQIEPHADAFVAHFYDRLFHINPGARVLFVHSDAASLRSKLIDMLREAVLLFDDPDRLVRIVAPLGRRHAGYGVRASDYEDACAALVLALRDTLGDAMTEEIADAWRELFRFLAAVMQRAGALRVVDR